VDWKRAAAILYGDWGTSKAYVIGLAFAVAGYSSFWLIAAMCALTALVGLNYMVICRLYPDGGGVYASVRHRSEVISIVGAFLLIADYLVTAAFSALSAIEFSLLVDRPNARYFAVTILAVGLILRGLVQERRMKNAAVPLLPKSVPVQVARDGGAEAETAPSEVILCAVRGTGRTLDFALREARESGRRLYLLFVREQRFMTDQDTKRKWQEDPEATQIFDTAKKQAGEREPLFCYAVSESAAETIADVAATLGASRLILGAPRRNALVNILRGNLVREVSDLLPEEIDLLVYA